MATIVTKNSSTASAVPTTSDLVQGELAVNVTDKRIFTENASTQIVELGTNPSTITTATATVTGTLTANGTFASNNAVITGGSINSTPIGATTPSTVRGSTVTATTGFVGGLTGNVTGNLTGNVTGNVVGNLTGNVTGNVTASTGTTTLNNLVVNGTADFTNTKLVNVTTPVAGTDAANKSYVDATVAAVIDSAPAALDTLNELAAALGDDANFAGTVTTALATKLPLAGGTMTGAIAMSTSKITGLGDPTAAQDAATKAYVDTQDGTKLSTTGGTMSGAIAMGTNKITGLGDPTLAQDAATKAYTDSILGSATSAADSAAAAATSASNASTSASNAASSATAASTSETNAALSATNAAASYDSFDDRYLGAKASDPTLDNDGDALIAGATYFNTATDSMKVYSGSAWQDVAPVATSVTLSQVTDFPSQSGQSGKYLSTNGTVPSWVALTTDPTLGTLTKTFANGESASISLTSSVLAPVVSVTKEVPQSGVTNNSWDVNSTTENYTRLDSAYATTLAWGADLANTAYDGVSYSTSVRDTNLRGIAFNPTGTKMYVLGEDNDNIYQYSLATAFDISSPTYDGDINIGPQITNGWSIAWSSDGTQLYAVSVSGSISTSVVQYTATTAYDLTTASYASKSFNFNSQENSPRGIAFNSDGTKMYTVGTAADSVFQYSLSTAWDVSTASYDSVSFSVASEDSSPTALLFNAAGTKMYILGDTNNKIFQYSLSTGFDVSTSSYDSVSFDYLSVSGTVSFGFTLNQDETKMLIATASSGNIYQFSLPKVLQLGTGSFASADVGKTIEANSGAFILTATDGSFVETTAPTSYAQVASGSWSMYGVVYNATDGDLEISAYNDVYNLATASYDSKSFSVLAQTSTSPQGMDFNADGTKMYIGSDNNDTVFQYSLATAFDISTASYDSVSFSVASQTSRLYSLNISTDGTKMLINDNLNQRILQYTLSTAFDLSTASYASIVFSYSSQDTNVRAFTFNNSGTKMYIVGATNDTIYQYSLTSAFDISTASYDTKSLVVASQNNNPIGVEISLDGFKLFMVGADSVLYEYNLSTAFDVSTGSYSGVSFSFTSQDTGIWALRFNNSGSKMFALSSGTQDSVFQYSTGSGVVPASGYHPVHTTASTDTTYWTDINSMTADQAAGDGNVYYAISTDDRTTWTVIDNTDGERDIVRNNAGTWQYNSNGTYALETWVNGTTNTELATLAEAMEFSSSIPTPFDVSNASFVDSFSIANEDTAPEGICFNNDGTKMYVVGRGGGDINEYDLSSAFDVSTASYLQLFSVTSQDTSPRDVQFNNDGTKMYVLGAANSTVFEYVLSAAFNVSTASYSQSFSVSAQETSVQGICFNNDGTKMFITGSIGDDVNEYALSSSFDVSTASYTRVSASISSETTYPYGIQFNLDGTKMFIVGSAKVSQYNLSTAFNVSSITFEKSFSLSGQESTTTGIAFNSDGSKMFITGQTTEDAVYEYSLETTVYPNQMDKTQLDAVTDPNHIALGNDLDLAIIFNMTSGTTVPSSDGVAINYDANVLNKGAVLGTDYDFDAPAQNSVRITALAANNLKVRVV